MSGARLSPWLMRPGSFRQSSFGTSLNETIGTNASTLSDTLRSRSSKLYYNTCEIMRHGLLKDNKYYVLLRTTRRFPNRLLRNYQVHSFAGALTGRSTNSKTPSISSPFSALNSIDSSGHSTLSVSKGILRRLHSRTISLISLS